MLDPKILRTNFDEVAKQLSRRTLTLDKNAFLSLENERKEIQTRTEKLQSQRNKNSKLIGQAKSKGEDTTELMADMENVNQELKSNETLLEDLQAKVHAWMLELPNLPHDTVPDGDSEDDNQEVRKWGEIPNFDFEALDHVDIGEKLGGLDFENAAKLTGSRFVVLHKQIARLHRALIQFMLDTHINEHGYSEVYVPFVVNNQSLTGTGQLPKFEEDCLFERTAHGHAAYCAEGAHRCRSDGRKEILVVRLRSVSEPTLLRRQPYDDGIHTDRIRSRQNRHRVVLRLQAVG